MKVRKWIMDKERNVEQVGTTPTKSDGNSKII